VLTTAFFAITLFWFNLEEIALLSFGAILLLNAIPSLYLHFEYWLMNRNEEFEIRENGIIQRKGGVEKKYNSQEISKVVLYLSPSKYKGSRIHFVTSDGYYYAEIILKTGEIIILTSLLSNLLEADLMKVRGILFDRRKSQFCNINRWW
jgi:hypothetical protein